MQQYYDRIWSRKLSLPKYATLQSRWRSRWEFAFTQIQAGSRVLDAGCGDGILGEMLIRRKQCDVVGLDISGHARGQAQQRGLECLACDISTERFPVEDADFDVVTMLCCLEHIFDPAHALREAARVVKPGGKVLVTLPNAVQLHFRWDFLRGRLSRDLLHTNDGEGLHIRFFNYAGDFERLVAENVSSLQLVEKIPTLKNPGAYHPLARFLLQAGLRFWPNLFAEYGNYILVKE